MALLKEIKRKEIFSFHNLKKVWVRRRAYRRVPLRKKT